MKSNEMKPNEMKANEMKPNEMKANEMKKSVELTMEQWQFVLDVLDKNQDDLDKEIWRANFRSGSAKRAGEDWEAEVFLNLKAQMQNKFDDMKDVIDIIRSEVN